MVEIGRRWVGTPEIWKDLPLGPLGRARGERPEWWAAGLVVLGLAAVLIVVPQREPPVVVAVGTVVTTAAVLGGMAVGLFGLAVGLPARVAGWRWRPARRSISGWRRVWLGWCSRARPRSRSGLRWPWSGRRRAWRWPSSPIAAAVGWVRR